MSLENLGNSSRVEFSVPTAKGPRTHTDIVLFSNKSKEVIACIECKSCITPDLFQKKSPNNNFTRLLQDTEKYSAYSYSPLYLVMWAIHWDKMDILTTEEFSQFKYFGNHQRMHQSGFNLTKIKDDIVTTFNKVGLGKVIHQCTINSTDIYRNSRASIICTLSCMS